LKSQVTPFADVIENPIVENFSRKTLVYAVEDKCFSQSCHH
jgi:hypothetical protein